MLTSDQEKILYLLRKSTQNQTSSSNTTKSVEFDEKQSVVNSILRNGILSTVFTYLPEDIKDKLNDRYYSEIKKTISQVYEGEKVLKALSNEGLDCIALKGWELMKLYDDYTMRQMADIDILVKPYDYDRIKTVMDRLGFSNGTESSWKHDSFRKSIVHIEMHKRLTDDSGAINSWESKMWERAICSEGNVYRMSNEDYYIFHFVHLHKDFLNGSLGLRRIVDTWLLTNIPRNMDVVKEILESFGMWSFHEKIVHLSRVAMGKEEMDEETEYLLHHAFKYGIYGSDKSYKAGRIASMGRGYKDGVFRSKLAAVFLPYKRMKSQFPVLQKWPILLPIYWIKRIIAFLKSDMNRNKRMMDYSGIKEEDYLEAKKFFAAGGILPNIFEKNKHNDNININ